MQSCLVFGPHPHPYATQALIWTLFRSILHATGYERNHSITFGISLPLRALRLAGHRLPGFFARAFAPYSPDPLGGNPSFLKFIQETGPPFRAMDSFRTAKMEERSDLYLRRQPIKAAAKESSKHKDLFRLPPVVLHKKVEGDGADNCNIRLQQTPRQSTYRKLEFCLRGNLKWV